MCCEGRPRTDYGRVAPSLAANSRSPRTVTHRKAGRSGMGRCPSASAASHAVPLTGNRAANSVAWAATSSRLRRVARTAQQPETLRSWRAVRRSSFRSQDRNASPTSANQSQISTSARAFPRARRRSATPGPPRSCSGLTVHPPDAAVRATSSWCRRCTASRGCSAAEARSRYPRKSAPTASAARTQTRRETLAPNPRSSSLQQDCDIPATADASACFVRRAVRLFFNDRPRKVASCAARLSASTWRCERRCWV